MAMNFPNAPNLNDTYSPSGGPTYTWDGEKWKTVTTPIAGKTPIYTDGSTVMAAQLTLFGPPTSDLHAADKAYVDSVAVSGTPNAMLTTGHQTITGGFAVTSYNQASGSFTVSPLNGNYQYLTNSGAFTITAPSVDCAVDILVTNGSTAGAINFSGFTVGASTGDALTTTNGARFIISIRRINSVSTYVIKALQ